MDTEGQNYFTPRFNRTADFSSDDYESRFNNPARKNLEQGRRWNQYDLEDVSRKLNFDRRSGFQPEVASHLRFR